MIGADTTEPKKTNVMRVSTEALISAISANEYVEKTENVLKENFPNLKLRNSKELTVAGREAPTRIYSYDLDGVTYYQYQVYIADGQKIYIISFTAGEKSFIENAKTYTQILNSFKI